MAQTVETYTGDGSTKLYSIPFPYIESTDVKVKIDGTLTTAFTFANATQLEFTTAPLDGNKIIIFRQTNDSAAKKEFSAGSALKAEDLNANTKQALFINQESTNQAASTLGATFVGDVEFGFGNVIKFEGATDDAHETTLTVTDPTADRSLSLPNVSGTLVSTGDTGTITSTMILNETIESGDIKNGTIVNDDISSTANIANTKIADGLLKSTLTVNSSNIVDGSIVNADINASADIQGSKLLNDSVTLDKLGSGALPTDITVASANIVNGTIVDADINSSANIDGDKLKDDSVSLAKFEGGALPTDITVASANIVNGTLVDSDINSSADIAGTKLANDSVPLTKFGSGALPTDITVASANVVDGTLVNADINASADIEGSKLLNDSVSLDKLGAGALPTDITVASSNLVNGTIVDEDINASADIEGSKLKNDSVPLTKFGSGALPTDITVHSSNIVNRSIVDEDIAEGTLDNRYFTEVELNNGQLNNLYYTETELNNGQLDNQYYTETELNNGQLNNLYFTETELLNGALDGRYFTETEAEANFYRQDSSETISSGQTWSNSDAFVATTAAINARIIDLVDDVGGFSTIATELVFPNTNPQGTTGQAAILSVGALSQAYTPSGTTVTIANGTVGNSTVTITGVPSVLPSGFGILVESTSTLNTYTFHRLVPKATEITTVAANATAVATAAQNVADINNFSDIYIISSSEPTQRTDGSSLQEGDLWFDNSNDNLLVYTGSAFSIITPSQSVLDDVAIVSGAITYSEDLGLIGDAVTTGSSNGSLNIVADALEDERTFVITVSGGAYFVDGVSKPALTLHKGWTYTFDVSDNSNNGHPLRFYSNSSQYSTNVTVTGTGGTAGAKVSIKIPETQPTNFQYYCTNHSGMGNTITVVEDPIKVVADIAANVVTVAGISGNVTTVANNNSNITSVANNESNINAVQGNASNINAAVSNASNINATVSNTTNINTVSASIADVNRYANEYKISASNPASPSAGDLWFDTSTNTLKNYNGAAWLGITSNSGIQNLADDLSPELVAALDCNNNNLTEVGTISGNNLQLDFGTL